MNKISCNTQKVKYFIITCCWFCSAHGTVLYGVGLTTPPKVEKSGIGEISQKFKPPGLPYSNFSYGRNNQQFNAYTNNRQNEDSYKPASERMLRKINSQQPSSVNKLNQDNIYFSDPRIPIKDDYKPSESENSGTLSKDWSTTEQQSDSYTPDWLEKGITVTSEYETITIDTLIRIGGGAGAPPAVVASLLG